LALKLITPPETYPVLLAEAKTHCRIDGTAEDDYISALITVATDYCENYQHRAFITQVWELWLDDFPIKDYVLIPRTPLQSVASVKYYDDENTEYTISDTEYFVDLVSEPGRVVLGYDKEWPSITLRPANAVCIRFTTGYASAADVPQKIKQAILFLVSHWYEKREPIQDGAVSGEIPFTVSALLSQDKIILA